MVLTALIASALASEPARLIQCDLDITLRDGSTRTVSGWSHDEDRAVHHATTVAWATAHWADAPSRWSLLAVAPELARERLRADLHRVGEPSAVPGVPQSAMSAPRCERVLPPRGKPGSGWTATWGAGEPITRSQPGIAMEAARRRTCLSAWQLTEFDRLSRGTPAATVALRERERMEAGRDTLLACLTARPDPSEVLVPGPSVAVPASEGVVQCSRPVQGEGLFAAWGVDLEDAREALLWRTAIAASRRAWRTALPEGVDEDALTAGALDSLRDLVVPDDATEQAMAVCATGPREGRPVLSWGPRDAGVAEACGLSTPAMMEVPDPFWLTSSPGELCRTHGTERAIAAVIPELAQSTVESGHLAAAGWQRALFCEARCWTDLRVEGWSPSPIRLTTELDRTDQAAAASILDAAIESRDLDRLGVLTGGVLLGRSYRELVAADPDAFWVSLATTRATAQWEETTSWIPIHGQWLLAFVGG